MTGRKKPVAGTTGGSTGSDKTTGSVRYGSPPRRAGQAAAGPPAWRLAAVIALLALVAVAGCGSRLNEGGSI